MTLTVVRTQTSDMNADVFPVHKCQLAHLLLALDGSMMGQGWALPCQISISMPCRASCCGCVMPAEGSIKPDLTSGHGLQGLWAWVLREAWPSPSAWPSQTCRRWLQPFTASLVWLRCVLLLPSVGCDSRCLASCDHRHRHAASVTTSMPVLIVSLASAPVHS